MATVMTAIAARIVARQKNKTEIITTNPPGICLRETKAWVVVVVVVLVVVVVIVAVVVAIVVLAGKK